MIRHISLGLLFAIASSLTGCEFIFDDGQSPIDEQPAPAPTPTTQADQPVTCDWTDSLTRDSSTGAMRGKVICTNPNSTPRSIAITVVACESGVQKAEGISGGTVGPNGKAEIDFIVLDTQPQWKYFIAEPNREYCS